MFDIARIQEALKKEQIDGWLLYDFRGSNPIAREVLQVPETILTRRWLYYIPAKSEPVAIQHALEPGSVAHLPGKKLVYRNRDTFIDHLKSIVKRAGHIAMEYSPMAALPTLSYVDKGTIELIESLGPEVISSARLIQQFLAVLTPEQVMAHRTAADKVLRIKDEAFARAAEAIRNEQKITEYDLQQFILKRFAEEGMVTEHDPIVAVNDNAGKPHYEPTATSHRQLQPGDLLLIDLWAREPKGPFADITWTAVLGTHVSQEIATVFGVVARARDAVVTALRLAHADGRWLSGADADRTARKVIEGEGYGEFILHRTGHSITTTLHGPGANLDDFETNDIRAIVPGLLFSVEPGIYRDDFGIRSEINVVMTDTGPVVTTLPLQTEVTPLLKK